MRSAGSRSGACTRREAHCPSTRCSPPLMDLTPETVRRAEFGRAWGGYDMREVDSFLEEVGNGVDALHARIRELTLRAERAESRGGGGLDDTIKRTLTLAQRAADLVVSEAKGVAERTKADAAATASRTLAAADEDANQLRARAEADGERLAAEHRDRAHHEHAVLWAQLQGERAVIEEQHRRTREDVAAMHVHAQATRDQLRATLADHLTRLDVLEFDAPSRFAALDLPALPDISLSAGSPEAVGEPVDVAPVDSVDVAPPESVESAAGPVDSLDVTPPESVESAAEPVADADPALDETAHD